MGLRVWVGQYSWEYSAEDAEMFGFSNRGLSSKNRVLGPIIL